MHTYIHIYTLNEELVLPYRESQGNGLASAASFPRATNDACHVDQTVVSKTGLLLSLLFMMMFIIIVCIICIVIVIINISFIIIIITTITHAIAIAIAITITITITITIIIAITIAPRGQEVELVEDLGDGWARGRHVGPAPR